MLFFGNLEIGLLDFDICVEVSVFPVLFDFDVCVDKIDDNLEKVEWWVVLGTNCVHLLMGFK